jgi:hypothetical protein
MVVIGVQTFRGSKPGGGAWGVEPGITDSYVYANPRTCVVGGTEVLGWALFEQAEVGWHVRGAIEERVGDLFVVNVEWERIWENGRRLEEDRKRTLRLALHMDERVTLEQILPDAPASCGTTEVRLETHVEMHPRFDRRSVGISGTGTAAEAAGAAAAGGPAQVDAQLWLVHARPDGTEESQMLTMTAGQGSANYRFAPVNVTTPKGSTSVRVEGFLRAPRSAAMGGGLLVMIDRRVTAPGGDERRGTTVKRVEMPAAWEVVAFEMPALSLDDKDVLPGHRFSLRVRLTK